MIVIEYLLLKFPQATEYLSGVLMNL